MKRDVRLLNRRKSAYEVVLLNMSSIVSTTWLVCSVIGVLRPLQVIQWDEDQTFEPSVARASLDSPQ